MKLVKKQNIASSVEIEGEEEDFELPEQNIPNISCELRGISKSKTEEDQRKAWIFWTDIQVILTIRRKIKKKPDDFSINPKNAQSSCRIKLKELDFNATLK
ncbi:hypothetical protein BpHYR1_012474 [Brachionus plicatilis]|uniref:Uncharacterized protein n=1 Tax=Brachionus plicatilis TaxID=10195 RepID=A0A3M7Q3N0_BRAPC|nr:hypothetical protein BpHYR1_012474 [Brachionus plicatilis]